MVIKQTSKIWDKYKNKFVKVCIEDRPYPKIKDGL